MSIDLSEIKIESYPQRSVGGQHVGIGPSGIHIIHLPTQIGVSCNSERSQYQNKEKAMIMLEFLLEINQ